MATQIKITQLTDIGSANLAVTTLLPVVNMAGVPTTQKTTLGNLANVILSQAGGNYAPVATANIAYSVANAAQPNITSTGTLTGLTVSGTTNLGAVGNVTITGGTNGQVLTTNGSNVLSWTTVSSGSSNTAVTVTANAQPNITSVGNLSYLVVNGNVDATNIDAANTVYANYFVGDGSSITDIDATNVIGNVANANYSTYAGTVITASQPNITSVGNLAGLTITGVTTLGTVTNLGDVGNVKIDGGIDGDVLGTDGANLFWVAQTDIGNFSFSNNIISLNVPANLVINSDGQNFIVNANSRLFTYKPDGTFVLPGGSEMFEASGNLNMISGGLILSMGPNANALSHWQFSGNGNLTLPGNTFAVNYANGTQVDISGGGANTGNVTFDDVTVQGAGAQLFLSPDPDFTANLAYVRVRAGDVASHIHMDTGNNEAYDLFLGDDNKFVQVSSTGNIIMSSYDGNTSHIMTLDTDGNLILAGGNLIFSDNSSQNTAFVGTAESLSNAGAVTVVANSSGNACTWSFNANGSLTLDNVGADSGVIGILDKDFVVAVSNTPNAGGFSFTFGQDGNLSVPVAVDSTDVRATTSVITPNIVGLNDGNISITANANSWLFDTTGTLTVPGGGLIVPASNTGVRLSAGASDATGLFLNNTGDAEIYANANVSIYTDAGNIGWTFDDTGNLTLPGNTVAIKFANSAAAFGNITSINIDGSSSNVLYGNGVFAAAPSSTYGNSNVATFLGSYGSNTITTTGLISGNGAGLTNLAGANVSGAVAEATLANTVAVSNVILNQEYIPAMVVSNSGNLGIKAPDGTANITYNPAQNRLTVENVVVGNTITASGKIGYASGANVTQTGSRSTSVTINALSGEITLFASSMAAGAVDFFTVTNNQLVVGDMIICTTYAGSAGTYLPMAFVSSNTQAVFTVRNLDSFVTASESPVIKFIVIKAPNS